jgi:hypothetical protein
MSRDDIIRMAREAYRAYMDRADRDDPWWREHGSKYYEDEAIKKAALAAAAAEREACAKPLEEAAQRLTSAKRTNGVDRHVADVLTRHAAAIRARRQA